MANFNEPTNATTYSTVLATLNDKIASVAKMDFTSDTNLPTGALRLNGTTGLIESWSGSAWVVKAYALAATVVNAATFTGDLTIASGKLLLPSGSATAPVFSFSGDTNTGIYSSVADNLEFTTGGVRRAVLSTSFSLTSVSSGKTISLSTDASNCFFYGNSPTYIGSTTADSLFFVTNNTVKATLLSDGKLGLGTTPTEALDVDGSFMLAGPRTNSQIKIGRLYGQPFTNADGAFMAFEMRGSSGANTICIGSNSGVYKGVQSIEFRLNANTTTTTSSQIGLFTATGFGLGVSPAVEMHIQRSGDCRLRIESTGGAAFDQHIHFKDTTSDWYIGNRYTNPNAGFGIGRTTEKNDFVINSSGQVAIGPVDPSELLVLASSTPRLRFQDTDLASTIYGQISGAGGNGTITLQADPGNASANSSIGFDVDGANIARFNNAGQLEIFSVAGAKTIAVFSDASLGQIHSTGGLRIGATTAAAFDIITSNTVRLTIASGGAFNCPGMYDNTTGSAANLFVASGGDVRRSTSSLRYKTNVQEMTYGLSDVLKLRPVTFNHIGDGENTYAGLIAEEVEEAGLTEFVVKDEEGRPDAINYANMVALAFKAIAELTERLEALENN